MSNNQTEHRHEESGDGPPLLFVHGYGGSTYSWRHIGTALAGRHRVVLIDLLGFGKSPKPRDAGYSPGDQAARLADFVIRKGLRNLTLVGHSFGGGVALLTALRLRDLGRRDVARMILIDSAALRQPFPFHLALVRIPLLGPLIVRLLPPRFQARAVLEFCYRVPGRVTKEQVAAYARPIAGKDARTALVKTVRSMVPPDLDSLSRRFAELDMPVLLVWGRFDPVVPLDVGLKLGGFLPDARVAVVEDCGHIPHEEKPAETLALIRRFLEEMASPDA